MLPIARTGICYGRNGVARALSVLDVGSSVFINGMQFSPDLSQCYGFKDDVNDLLHPIAAAGQSSDTTTLVTGKVGYNSSGLLNDKVAQSIALTNGKILCYGAGYVGPIAADVPGYLLVVNPATGKVESSQLITASAGWSQNVVRAFHRLHFVDTGSVILGLLSFDDQANALNNTNYDREGVLVINRATGAIQSSMGLVAIQNQYGVGAPFVSGADSGAIFFSGGGITTTPYSIGTSAGSTAAAVSKNVGPTLSTNNMLQANYCLGKAANSFYSLHVGSGTDKFISYTLATVPATNSTSVACTINDITPMTDMGNTAAGLYESTKNAAYESKVVTLNGVNYLIFVTRLTFSSVAGTIAQYGMFAYQIDAVDPTKLTLTAYQKFATAPLLGCFDPNNMIWVYAAGTLTAYTFNGTSFVAGAAISVNGLTDLVFTQQNTVIGIDKVNRYAYNLTIPTAYVIDCYFQESQLQFDSAALTAHVVVNVYDGTGARQAKTVQLILQGGTFQAGGTSVSVTTSTSGDTVVPVTITNPGLVAVTPSLQ